MENTNLQLQIAKERKQLNLFKILILVGVLLLVAGVIGFIATIAESVNWVLENGYANKSEAELEALLYEHMLVEHMLVPITLVSMSFPIGIAMIVIFSIFKKKKHGNIHMLENYGNYTGE